MKITFISNYLNHHQLPFCLEMKKRIGEDFKFVATEVISKERLNLGYDNMNDTYDFVVKSYENEEQAYNLVMDSDVVIFGNAPRKFIKQRIKNNKLTFIYSERIFKEGFKIKVFLSLLKNYYVCKRKKVYLLCSSAYTARDYNIATLFINKAYKWGYFPQVKKYDLDNLFKTKSNNKIPEIIWVGRFIDIKHPEKVIEIAKKLKEENYDFKITMLGTGYKFNEIKEMINKYKLENHINLLGNVNNKEVRKYMEKANIYLFTSDYNEGWGAVLNESMNSGCAVIASHAIGSVPFLIDDGKNGLIYNNDSIDDLYYCIKKLINDKQLQNRMGLEAYNTMINYWNAQYATESLLKLIDNINNEKNVSAGNENKPCEIAKSIPQKKMYMYVKGNYNDKKTN